MTTTTTHTELIDGALVFMMSPQRSWHGRLVTALTLALSEQAPDGIEVEREMSVRLDDRNRPEPDIVAAALPYDPDRTWFPVQDVLLVIEVVSAESAHRDRTVKLHKYANAGIPHCWRVEDEQGTASRPRLRARRARPCLRARRYLPVVGRAPGAVPGADRPRDSPAASLTGSGATGRSRRSPHAT